MQKTKYLVAGVLILLVSVFTVDYKLNDNSSVIFRSIKTFFTSEKTGITTPLSSDGTNDESAYHDDPASAECCPVIANSSAAPRLPTEQEARDQLARAGVGINAAAPKTQVGGIPQAGLNAIIAINAAVKTASGSGCVVTGGTEPGHATHCVGKAIWDFRDTPGTRNWIMGQDKSPVVNGAGNKKYTVKIGGQVVVCTYELRPPKYKQDRFGNLRKGMSHFVHWHCELQQCVDPASGTRPATTKTQS